MWLDVIAVGLYACLEVLSGWGLVMDQVWSWTRSGHGPGLVMGQVWSWTRSGHGPGLVMDQVWSYQVWSWTRSGHGPGLVMDQVWSRTRSGHRPGLVMDQVWSRTRSGHGPYLTRTRAQDIHTNRRQWHPATYYTNNQRTYISGIQSSDCTKYGMRAPWRWSNR